MLNENSQHNNYRHIYICPNDPLIFYIIIEFTVSTANDRRKNNAKLTEITNITTPRLDCFNT